jgi:hypothetical protein
MDLVLEAEARDAETEAAWAIVNRAKGAPMKTDQEHKQAREAELQAVVDRAEEIVLEANIREGCLNWGHGTSDELMAAQIVCCRTEIALQRALIALMKHTRLPYHQR